MKEVFQGEWSAEHEGTRSLRESMVYASGNGKNEGPGGEIYYFLLLHLDQS